MSFNFVNVPFQTDLPELLDLRKDLKKGIRNESEASWNLNGRTAIHMRQTLTQAYPQGREVDGLLTEAEYTKLNAKYVSLDLQDTVRQIGERLANTGWLCVSFHPRPDDHVKMEWFVGNQFLLTINLYRA